MAVIDDFVTESLPNPLNGMNAVLLSEYVRFQSDCVMEEMGYDPVYDIEKVPFDFMDKLTLNGVAKTNFFEVRALEYQGNMKPENARFAVDTTPLEDDGGAGIDIGLSTVD
jgi:ribonucleotide reductase beta subunit family protein with ferritin-like domain